jgi:hypothetical protein
MVAPMTSIVEQCTDAVHSLLAWTNKPAMEGNADQWSGAAAAAGYSVTHTPAAGDVAVWQPGQAGAGGVAGSVGHVADVTNVAADGTVTVQGANWPDGSGIHAQTLLPNVASQLSYIAPLGGTPPPGATAPAPAAAAPVTAAPAGLVTDVLGFLPGLFGIPQISSPVPWFERHLVPILTGLAITLVITGKPKAPGTVVNLIGGGGPAAGPATDDAADDAGGITPEAETGPASEPAWLTAHRARGMVHDMGPAADVLA